MHRPRSLRWSSLVAVPVLLLPLWGCDSLPTEPGVPLTWSEPQRIHSLSNAFTQHPIHRVMDLAAAPDGSLHLTILGGSLDPVQGSSFRHAYHAAFSGGSWGAPRLIAESPTHLWLPRAVGDRNGTVHLFWLENLSFPGERQVLSDLRYRTIHRGTWSAPTTLSEIGRSGRQEFDVALDPDGRVNLFHQKDGRFHHRLVESGRITTDRPTSYGGVSPRFVAHRNGRVDAVWIGAHLEPGETGTRISDVLFGSDQGQGWGPVRVVYRNDVQHSHLARLVVDSRGVRHLVWGQSLDHGFLPVRVLYSRSVDGVAWSEPAEIGHSAGMIWNMELHLDRRDRLHLVFDTEDASENSTIRYARMEQGQWSAPEILFAHLGSVHALYSTLSERVRITAQVCPPRVGST